MEYYTLLTKDNFKQHLKRLVRQLSQRAEAVNKGQRPDKHYQNKRKEFIKFINTIIKKGWFIMPSEGTRIWRIYYDIWN